ncbi:MAG TPA: DnaJ C-terminal domain-containing protein [Thermoplasmata archaeon]|nr:DnaJ C-terminal domain-containing protein [Thermoplasmata archaeon]
MSKDHYRTLGVARDASPDQVKGAFRELAKKYHPDKNREKRKWAEEKFKEISEAYEVLADPKKRRFYDAGGMDEPIAGPAYHRGHADDSSSADFDLSQFTHFKDIEDIFSDDAFRQIFGDDTFRKVRTPFGRARFTDRGGDITTSVTLGLEDLFEPRKVRIRYPRVVRCVRCTGSGSRTGSSTCSTCRGSGQVKETSDRRPGFIQIASCPRCRGTGRHVAEPCRECGGSGKVEKENALSVAVPAGAAEGTRLRVPGQGDEGEHGAGDLHVEVKFRDHPTFRREGADLVLAISLTFPRAALGTKTEVTTVDGRKVALRIPRGIQHGTRLRLDGLGLPRPGGARGALLVEVHLKAPEALSKRETELYEEMLRAEEERTGKG